VILTAMGKKGIPMWTTPEECRGQEDGVALAKKPKVVILLYQRPLEERRRSWGDGSAAKVKKKNTGPLHH